MDEANMDTELFYFVPGQVILHLEHSKEATDMLNDRVTRFLRWLEEMHGIQLTLLPERTITFPVISIDAGIAKGIAEEIGEDIGEDIDKEWKISLALAQFEIPPMEEYRQKVYIYQGELIDLLVSLYDILGKGIFIPGDGNDTIPGDKKDILLRFISPNWLSGGAPHLPGVGGPGSWPVPAYTPSPVDEEWKFSFPDFPDSADFINSTAGEGVEVAILDTAHDQDVLKNAFSQWSSHPLLAGLLGVHGKLMSNQGAPNVVRYKFSDQEMLDHTSVNGDVFLKPWDHFSLVEHNYEMPDHGLFVAGIIHTIAPLARLKLYEVLNPYGSGSYESIASGLESVLQDLEANPVHKLIINLSLVLSMPFIQGGVFKHIDPGLTDRYSEKIKYFEMMSASVQDLIEQLVKLDNVLVVAAAGNDSHSPSDRPPARYPAVCPGVIGVGAMPKSSNQSMEQNMEQGYHSVASYSNLCDQPPSAPLPPYSGYVTLGGEADAEQGILGVYIHGFPSNNSSTPPLTDDQIQNDHNYTGWAWWAGTSFATPIITGLLAAGWSNNWESLPQSPGPTGPISAVRDLGFGGISAEIPPILRAMQPGLADRAHNFLHRASGAGPMQAHRTRANERVIEARQP